VASRPGSGAVTTIAILHFVGGGLGLLQSFCRGANAFFLYQIGTGNMPAGPVGPGQRLPLELALFSKAPGFFASQVAMTGVGLVLDVLLIIAGIGLLSRKSWARWGSVGYGVLSLIFKLIIIVYWIAVVAPVIGKLEAEEAGKIKQDQMGQQQLHVEARTLQITQPAILGVLMIYPIVVILVMFMPSVKRYFQEDDRYGRDDDDYHDRDRYEEDYPRRSPRIDRSGQIYREDDEDDRGRRWRDDDRDRGRWRDDERDRDRGRRRDEDEEEDRPRRWRDDDR
jgi:hypothetical protein